MLIVLSSFFCRHVSPAAGLSPPVRCGVEGHERDYREAPRPWRTPGGNRPHTTPPQHHTITHHHHHHPMPQCLWACPWTTTRRPCPTRGLWQDTTYHHTCPMEDLSSMGKSRFFHSYFHRLQMHFSRHPIVCVNLVLIMYILIVSALNWHVYISILLITFVNYLPQGYNKTRCLFITVLFKIFFCFMCGSTWFI